MSELVEARLDGPSGRIMVDDGGTATPAVIFVHSLAGTLRQWIPQLRHLRPERRAIALDLRGHGASDPPHDGDYAPAAMAADVVAVADALALDRVALVGHSLGAGVAIAAAGAHPDRVAGLFLADPIGDTRKAPAEEWAPFLEALDSDAYRKVIRDRWESILEGAAPGVEAAVMDDLRTTPRDTVVGAFRALTTFDPITPLERYDGPVRALITPLNHADYSLHRLVDIPTQELKGTGHWLQLDAPEAFNRHLDAFLRELA